MGPAVGRGRRRVFCPYSAGGHGCLLGPHVELPLQHRPSDPRSVLSAMLPVLSDSGIAIQSLPSASASSIAIRSVSSANAITVRSVSSANAIAIRSVSSANAIASVLQTVSTLHRGRF